MQNWPAINEQCSHICTSEYMYYNHWYYKNILGLFETGWHMWKCVTMRRHTARSAVRCCGSRDKVVACAYLVSVFWLVSVNAYWQTRLLVTHGIQWLPKVDNIVVVVDGEISESGSYEELLSHDRAFAQFLRTYIQQQDEDEEDEERLYSYWLSFYYSTPQCCALY